MRDAVDFHDYLQGMRDSARNLGVRPPSEAEVRSDYLARFGGSAYPAPEPAPVARRAASIHVPSSVRLREGLAALQRVGALAYERDQNDRAERNLSEQTPEEWAAEINEHSAALSPEERVEYLEDVVFRDIPAADVGKAVAAASHAPAIVRDVVARVHADPSLSPIMGTLARDGRTGSMIERAAEEGLGELSLDEVRETRGVPLAVRGRLVDVSACSNAKAFIEAYERGDISRDDFELAMGAQADRYREAAKPRTPEHLKDMSVDQAEAFLKNVERENRERAKAPAHDDEFYRKDIERLDAEHEARHPTPDQGAKWAHMFPKSE